MRIGLDCRITTYTSGGTAMYARRLANALARLTEARPEHLVVLDAARSPVPTVQQPPPNFRRARLFTPSHHRFEQLALPIELLPHRLDLLHSTDFIPPFVRRCRSVITVHDLAFLRYPELLTAASRRYFNGQIDRAVRSADRIIAVSQATKRDLVELLRVPDVKIEVIHEAQGLVFAPLSSGGEGQGERLSHPSDYILFVGTLEPRKNLPVLVRAFAEVRRRGYAGKLLLAGAVGWLADPIFVEIERQSLGDAVMVTDVQPELYQHARLLAFPSLYEGFGIPILEAMATGLPVVTSNVSSMPEVAGDAALLIDPTDVGALADAMWRVLTDSALASDLRRKGLARSAEFSWDRAARETLAVYQSIA